MDQIENLFTCTTMCTHPHTRQMLTATNFNNTVITVLPYPFLIWSCTLYSPLLLSDTTDGSAAPSCNKIYI